MYDNTIDKPEVEDEMYLSVPDHVVVLSFTDDEDAIIFREWWDKFGFTEFAQYALGDQNGQDQ